MNPFKSVKNLGKRIRRKSRKSQDDFTDSDLRSATSESEQSSTTPSLAATPLRTDEVDARATFQQQEPSTDEKKPTTLSNVLNKGKEAMAHVATKVETALGQTSASTADDSLIETDDTSTPEELPTVPPAANGSAQSSEVMEDVQYESHLTEQQPKPSTSATNDKTNADLSELDTTTVGRLKERALSVVPEDDPAAEQPAANEAQGQQPADTQTTETEQTNTNDIHASSILRMFFYATVLFWLTLAALFGVSKWETTYYSFLTFVATLGFIYVYHERVKKKKREMEALNITPGVDGLRMLLKDLPTWLSYTKKERVEWFNKALLQMWPSYDKAICAAIKESVEPIVQSVKPPIFKDIRFSQLKFGDAPFRVEGVEIFDITENEMVVDLDIRWSGDANITLAIEPNIPTMTDVTRMQPKVTDISCYGTLRLIFKPLVAEMPGFGAVITTFVRTPKINFTCDFGKALGGGMSGKLVRNALDSFIRDTLINMYVWPQRYVVPIIYDEAITGPIEDLELRHVGVLTVKILKARDLPAADMNGYSDPTIELWTRPERKYNTAVQKKTLNPVWQNEIHNLLIQEPRSQNISVTAYDVDFFNASDMLKSFNVIKNLRESVNAKEFLGRASIPIRSASERPGEEIEDWYELGSNSFGHTDGPGTGCGQLHMKMVYTPFSMLTTENSLMGAVLVTIVRCRDLVAMDRGGTSDPYVKLNVNGITKKTHVVNASCNPEFHVNFEFFDVPITEVLNFSVFDKDFVTRDDPIGTLDISIRDLASSFKDGVPGSLRNWFKLKAVDHGDIQLRLQYIPMDTTTRIFD